MTNGIESTNSNRRHNATFYAGLGIGVGLFGVRIAGAQTHGDFLIASALTVAEFSVVYLWERKTAQLGDLIVDFDADEKVRGRARGVSRAAAASLADRQALVDEVEGQIEEMEQEFERDHLLSDLKALTAIATNAIRAGYHAGISGNAGAVSGGATLEEDNDEHE